MINGSFTKPHRAYVNGAKWKGVTVVAPTAGYARFSNLATARNIWSGTTSSGDNGAALTPPPTAAIIKVYGQAVRMKLGANPTSTEGIPWEAGVCFVLEDEHDLLQDVRFIEITATAEVTIEWLYGED